MLAVASLAAGMLKVDVFHVTPHLIYLSFYLQTWGALVVSDGSGDIYVAGACGDTGTGMPR